MYHIKWASQIFVLIKSMCVNKFPPQGGQVDGAAFWHIFKNHKAILRVNFPSRVDLFLGVLQFG